MKVIHKNQKKIDCILFYDEIEMLKFRLSELNPYVDFFVIMECEVDFKGNRKRLFFEENKHLFEEWGYKIIHIITRDVSKDLVNSICELTDFTNITPFKNPSLTIRDVIFCQTYDLHRFLISFNLSPEDIILLSDVDEIPNLSDFKFVVDNLNFEPVILSQKNFIWSTDYYDPTPHLGTCCFQFASLIGFPSRIYQKYFSKQNRLIDKTTICQNGYHFAHFYNLEKTIEKLKLVSDEKNIVEKVTNGFENLISIFDSGFQTPPSLIEYDGILPEFHSLLPSQKIGRDYSKKYTVLFNSEKKSDENTSVVNFTFDPSLPEKGETFNILLPKTKYYDILIEENSLDNFQKMYGANEVKKILFSFYPLSKDYFVFINGDKSLEYSWSELKNEFLYDKIKDIL